MQWPYSLILPLVALIGAEAFVPPACSLQLRRELLDCMRDAETSDGNVCVIGDGGRALGPYQISQNYYADAIQQYPALTSGGQSFSSVWGINGTSYSEEVILAYMCRYATEARLGRPVTEEDIARIHDGGPNGFNDSTTLPYWMSVSSCIQLVESGGTTAPSTGSSDMCDPPCEQGQCCQQDDRGNFRCLCVETVPQSLDTYQILPCLECRIAGIDLQFLLDGSGSIQIDNFQNAVLPFVRNVVTELEISPTRSQVGVIVYSSFANVEFSLTTYTNETSLLAAIDAIVYPGGGTNTAAVLDLLLSQGFTGARPPSEGIPRVAIVLTDGQSNDPTATAISAMAIHQAVPPITVYGVGIGSGINVDELNTIASDPDDQFAILIEGFSQEQIEDLTEMIVAETCTAAIFVPIATTVERNVARGTAVFLIFAVPSEGFTIIVNVTVGSVLVCGLRTAQRPDCGFNFLHDWIRVVTTTTAVYITSEGLDSDSLSLTRRRRQAAESNETMYVTIEGNAPESNFMVNSTLNDTRPPAVDPCYPSPCDENAFCEEDPREDRGYTCTCITPYQGSGEPGDCARSMTMGDDPHFSIVLPSGELLCYTVQGEHGFAFNLISNEKLHMNAVFLPDSRREEVTWLGSIGLVVKNLRYRGLNNTKLTFNARTHEIHIGYKVTLNAKYIATLTIKDGKLTISEADPVEGFNYPSVDINLDDAQLHFTIKFMGEHLDMFWHGVGHKNPNTHGLIGQFFREGVEIDKVRKILILPGKEPVPVMRRPVWSFMERETRDDQLCWTAMNLGYQGAGLIDGNYMEYVVTDILSTEFSYKEKNSLKARTR